MEMINEANAQHAKAAAGVSKFETLELLRSGGKTAADMLRSLDDEQLATTASLPAFGPRRVEATTVAEMVLIGHPKSHLESLKGG
ncbi:MAG: hypothetical protein WEB00_13625 [Dehalococcoidia bacterium]